MDTVLGLIGAGIITLSACYYVLDILRGETRPQRTSWGVWALVGVLGFGTSESGGAGPGAWSAGVDGVASVLTFALSLHPRYGKPGGRRIDPLLGAVAVAGVVLWRWGPLDVTAAAASAVGCDIVALWPTLREGWQQPRTESLPSWSADMVGHLVCVAAVSNLSFAALAFPAYMVLATAAMTVVLVVRRRVGSGQPETAPATPPTPETRPDRTADVRQFGPVEVGDEAPDPIPGYGKAGTVSRSDFFSDGGMT